MKLAIVGSRDYSDIEQARKIFKNFFKAHTKEIISGGADGADSIGASLASENDITLTEHRPDWQKHGKAAGMVRNKLIIDDCHMVLAFWDGKSKGTANSLGHARRQGKPTFIIYFTPDE